jgi:hypothetical protein
MGANLNDQRIKHVQYRDKVVSLKLTAKEFASLHLFAEHYGLPPSTAAYLIVKDRLNTFDPVRNPDIGFF